MKEINFEKIINNIQSSNNFYEQVDIADSVFDVFCPKCNVARVDIYNDKSGEYGFYRTVYNKEGECNEDSPLIIEDLKKDINDVLELEDIETGEIYKNDLGSFVFKVYPINKFSFEDENNIITNISKMHEVYKVVLNVLEKNDPRTKMPVINSLYNVSNLNTILSSVDYNVNNKKRSLIYFNIKELSKINTKCGTLERGNIVFDEIIKNIKDIIIDITHEEPFMVRNSSDNFIILVDSQYRNDICNTIKSFSLDMKLFQSVVHFNINCYGIIYDINKYNYNSNTINNLTSAIKLLKEDKRVDFVDYSTYDDELNIMSLVKNEFEQTLDDERIIPYFQPKVDAKTNRLCGAEILCRWIRKDGKMIFPGNFVPILEKSNRIEMLDFYMLHQTCKAIKKCIASGLNPVPISVNFSRNHFDEFDDDKCSILSDKIIDIIKNYNIDFNYVQIELTESGKLKNPILINKFINKLRTNGIKVLMDDFGTENSTILDLISLSFDVVKIDKSFLKDLLNSDYEVSNSKRKAIHDTVDMIKNQGRVVVFEGVEIVEELDFLRSIGCDIIQGYYFDKPLPFEEFEKRIINPSYGELNNIDNNMIYSLPTLELMYAALKDFNMKMFVKDLNGKYIFLSDNTLQNKTEEENVLETRDINGKKDNEIRRQKKAAEISMNYDKKVLEDRKEVKYVIKESDYYYEIYKKPLLCGQKLIGIFGTCCDVTKRELEKEKLEKLAFQNEITKCYKKEYINYWYNQNKNSDMYPLSIVTTVCDDLKIIDNEHNIPITNVYIKTINNELEKNFDNNLITSYIGNGIFISLIPFSDNLQVKEFIEKSKKFSMNLNIDENTIYDINELTEFIEEINNDVYNINCVPKQFIKK